MFVVNFDFTDHILPLKLLAINIPVVLTQIITYPMQRLQTLLVSQPSYITKSQTKEARLILRSMLSVEGFPKMLHGMRYSVDYMATQMTTKFFLFDFLIEKTMDKIKQNEKWPIIIYCLIANAAGTAVSQIAFNYQTLASSLPVDKNNRAENVKIKLQNYTRKYKFPINGLKYTLPISIINTVIELGVLSQTTNWLQRKSSFSYALNDLLSAFLVFSLTSFTSHYAFQRQVQICKELPERSIPYTKGLLGSFIRYNTKGLTLFSLYLLYFQWRTKKQIEDIFQKRNPQSQPQRYRK